jgi:hypothetical protein
LSIGEIQAPRSKRLVDSCTSREGSRAFTSGVRLARHRRWADARRVSAGVITCCAVTLGWPYDDALSLSRPVLRAAGGETPPADSPGGPGHLAGIGEAPERQYVASMKPMRPRGQFETGFTLRAGPGGVRVPRGRVRACASHGLWAGIQEAITRPPCPAAGLPGPARWGDRARGGAGGVGRDAGPLGGSVPGNGAGLWIEVNAGGSGDYAGVICLHTGPAGLDGAESDTGGTGRSPASA